MRKIILLLILSTSFALSYSQNCKPSIDQTDKISKAQNIAWESIIFETSFWGSMLSSTDWDLKLQFGRYSNSNLMTLFLIRREASQQKMDYESQYRGEKGKEFYLAFTNGEAMNFIIHSTNTQSKIDPIDGKFVTVVTLSTTLNSEQIKTLKNRYDSGILSAARIALAGGIYFEKAINEKKGNLSKEKFNCFYDYAQRNPTKISQQFIDTYKLKENPSGILLPESLPLNENTGKITFSEVIEVPSVSKSVLFDRAKKWSISYFKNDKFSILSMEDGQLFKTESFNAEYPSGGGKSKIEKHLFTLSIWVKDGKFKYELTDIMDTEENRPIEKSYQGAKETLANDEAYAIWKKYVDQQIYLATYEIISALKKGMAEDTKKDNGW